MEPDLGQHPPMFLDQQQQISSGLTRYRSAPSSYFSNIIDKEFYESTFNRPSSPETERIFARFMNNLSGSGGSDGGAEDSVSQNIQPGQQVSVVKEEIINQQSHDVPSMNNEQVLLQQQQQQSNINNYGSSTPQKNYQSSGRPPLPNHMKTGRGSTSNLIRHGSSPAGLFSTINIEGYTAIRGIGTMGTASSTSENANFSPAARLKNAQNYSSGIMLSKAEIRNESNEQNNQVKEAFAESQGNDFIPGFPVSPWDESSILPDNLGGVKRPRDDGDDDIKPFSRINAAETQNETGGEPSVPLAHQLSMPNTTMEMAAIEKFLQSSDSVPWKIRAKRGFATHPRSIAERVRRTKISERMKKLQDLVPTMDNQTKTADMLDLAVEYIKDLQKQVQTLSESRAKCSCSHKQQQ
ncbi:hypothetical protein TanjilG_23509 [Lupinus angustifolius]|uniref:BHLH domain-containing protein n=1 Tax=Lupinus angustifolius TaxID=3871 RepID=A0A4P1RAD6_LUPAN|nr:PREDICTED: transcription factor bHLH122-like [Lupinus angustifolius]OIW05723.1 hypothetical protein TanjilG_23509 [Lupinus angustifolius]